MFGLGLDDNLIKSNKRLFMTATEKMLTPRLREMAEAEDRLIFSMDDEDVYGPVFHRMNFGKAIDEGIISDYKVVIAAIKEKEIYDWIKNDALLGDNIEGIDAFAEVLFTQILLEKSIKTYGIKKIITFHNSVKNAQIFIRGKYVNYDLKSILEKFNSEIVNDDLYIDHVNGTYSAGYRKLILERFRNSKYGIISNSKCLTEGVDVPVIDSVYFVDPKNSLIDIVQACGRALRKPKGDVNKIAYIIIPILIPEGLNEEAVINSEEFETVFNVIQALRDQDNRMEQWIDILNRQVSQGRYIPPGWNPIDLEIPIDFDIEKFEEKLLTRVAIVNSEASTSKNARRKIYGRKERKSTYNRIFRTFGDYSFESFQNSLIDPTIQKFTGLNETIKISKLRVNHNNVSHTRRLGLIVDEGKKVYSLSSLGKKYFRGEVTLQDLFKQQMLKYFLLDKQNKSRILFPYRTCLKLLMKTREIDFLHFAYPICKLYDSTEESISEAIEGIEFINEEIPYPDLLNETNKNSYLKEFNDLWNQEYSYEDIWVRNTTLYNQFIYFRNHLSLFSNCIKCDGTIKLIEQQEDAIKKLLDKYPKIEELKDQELLNNNYLNFINVVLFSLI